MVELIDFEYRDVARFASHLSDMDALEVWMSHGASVYDVLRYSVEASTRVYSARLQGVPLALCGVAPIAPGIGSIWLLGTDAIRTRRLAFGLACKRFLPVLTRGFQVVENYVWAEYEAALRWVRWLGFTVEPAAPWGAAGAPFCHVWMEA